MKRQPLIPCPSCLGKGFHTFQHFDGEETTAHNKRCMTCRGYGMISKLKAAYRWKAQRQRSANFDCNSQSLNT